MPMPKKKDIVLIGFSEISSREDEIAGVNKNKTALHIFYK